MPHAARPNAEALEIAVNTLPEKSLDAILSIYAETAEQYAADAAELEGIAEGLQPVVDDPAGYAGNAIIAAKYERVEIRTRPGGSGNRDDDRARHEDALVQRRLKNSSRAWSETESTRS